MDLGLQQECQCQPHTPQGCATETPLGGIGKDDGRGLEIVEIFSRTPSTSPSRKEAIHNTPVYLHTYLCTQERALPKRYLPTWVHRSVWYLGYAWFIVGTLGSKEQAIDDIIRVET
ncbi:hypothetical protein VTK73DRAFT_8348 [Phialemonium thermophilum]|uniref:Uncharacterized protein n=1 Tax=Phialemonium thermophilum TaxID=223376 RepID=A0ABR3Y7P0_9PEZI